LDQSFLGLVRCANVNVLSADGLSNLAKGDWFYQRSAISLWTLLLVFVLIAMFSWRRSRLHTMEFGISREEFLYRQAAEKPARRTIKVDQESWMKFKEAAKLYNRSRFTTLVMYMLQKNVLGSAASMEHDLMRSIPQGLIMIIMVGSIHRMIAINLGIFTKDAHILLKVRDKLDLQQDGAQRRHSTASMAKASNDKADMGDLVAIEPKMDFARLATLKESFTLSADKFREEFAAASWSASCGQMWLIFKAFHPIVRVMQLSMTTWWFYHVMVVAISVFSTLAISAFFLESSSKSINSASFEECQEVDFWVNVARDVIVSIISSIISLGPYKILMYLHRRQPLFTEDSIARARRIKRRLMSDMFSSG